jgi:hypothetical protein
MGKSLTVLLLIATVVLGLGWLNAARSASAASAELNRARADNLLIEAQNAGYVSAFAAVRDGLLARDSAALALQDALRRAETRLAMRVEMTATSTIDTVLVGVPVEDEPQHVVAQLDHDPFYGSIRFEPPVHFALRLVCAPRLEQYVAEAPDGRWLVSVRALSPHTHIELDALEVTPRVVPRSKRATVTRMLLTAGAGAFIWELVR